MAEIKKVLVSGNNEISFGGRSRLQNTVVIWICLNGINMARGNDQAKCVSEEGYNTEDMFGCQSKLLTNENFLRLLQDMRRNGIRDNTARGKPEDFS